MATQTLEFMDSAVMDDPTRYYQEVLGSQPFQDPETGLWIVSRHEDVNGILANSNNYSNALTLFPHYPLCDEAMAVLGKLQGVPATTAGGDGELHARAHKAITGTFPSTVRRAHATMGGIVEKRVAELLTGLSSQTDEAADGQPTVDLIRNYAWELPLRVNMDVLGFSPDRYDDIKTWSMGQIALTWGKLEPAEQVRAAEGLVSLWQECQQLVASRKAAQAEGQPLPEDMTSRLVQLQEHQRREHVADPDNNDEPLADDDLASIILNMAVAGHETTANAIGNAIYHLLSQPGDAWRRLGENQDPAHTAQVVEEELRLNPPIIGWSRLTNREAVVGGVTIPASQRILLLLGAANRDEAAFARPDAFEPERIARHLSFGRGIHFCVGAALARLEIAAALTGLAQSYPDAQLAPGFAEQPGKFHHSIGFHALRMLPVALGQRSAAAQRLVAEHN